MQSKKYFYLHIYKWKKSKLKRKTFSNENGWKNMYFALALFLIFIMEKHFYNEQHFNEYFFPTKDKKIYIF